MRTIKIKKGEWIDGISDRLILECGFCGNIPVFDYTVDDKVWKLLVPVKYRLGVCCLECLDRLATHKGINIGEHLEIVQFTGIRKTIELIPIITYKY